MFVKTDSDFFQQLLALVPVLVNVFFCHCHLIWLANATYYLTKADNVPSATLSECANIASFLEVGKLLFSWPSGMLFDKFGSRKIIFVIGCFNFLTWMMLVFTSSITMIYFIRILAGGVFALNFCTYIGITGEVSSPELRSTNTLILAIVGRWAGILQSAISVIFGTYQSINISSAILSLLFLPASFLLLESPYFLAIQSPEKAKLNLGKLHPSHSALQIDQKFDDLQKLMDAERTAHGEASLWQIFGRQPFRSIFLVICLVNGFAQLCGTKMVVAYSTVILPTNEWVPNSAYILVADIIILAAQLYGTTIIERYSRRLLFVASCLFVIVARSLMGTLYYYSSPQLHSWTWTVLATFVLTEAIISAILMPLTELITTEFFPASIKGKASGCVIFTRSVFTIFGFELFGYLSVTTGVYANFYLYAFTTVILLVIIYLWLPESRGRSLVDLQWDTGIKASANGGTVTYGSTSGKIAGNL